MGAEVGEVTETDFQPAAAAAAGRREAAPSVHRRQHRGRGRVLLDGGLPWLLDCWMICKLGDVLVDRSIELIF